MRDKRWYQDWLGWVLVISIGYGLICLLSLTSDVGRPFPGFLTYHNFTTNRMDVFWNAPGWWWQSETDRVALTDILLSVNDVPFNDLTGLLNEQIIYENVWDEGIRSVKIQVERNSQSQTLTIPLHIFSWQDLIDLLLAPFVITSTVLLLAIILYQASGDVLGQRLAILILVTMAGYSASINTSLFHYGQFHDHFLGYSNQIYATAVIFLGPLLIHFAWNFTTPIFQDHNVLSRMPLLFYSVALLATASYFLSRFIVNLQGITPVMSLLDRFALDSTAYLLIFGVFGVIVRMIGDGFLRRVQPRSRREARLMLAAFLCVLPIVWLSANGIFGNNSSIANIRNLADTRYFALAVPFAFAAISLRYHTFAGAERWLFMALVLAVSGFLANAGTAVLFWQQPQLIRELPFPPTAVLFLLFLLTGLVWGWQSGWRGWLRRVFHWDRVSAHEVQQYGQRLVAAPHTDGRQLAQTMAAVLCQELQVTHTTVWLAAENGLELTAVAGGWPEPAPPWLDLPENIPLTPFRLGANAPVWARPLCPHAIVVLPLILSGRLLGIMASGSRWDTAVFDDRDLDILALIAQQSAVFLQNAQQTAQLRQADRQLLQIQEETQRKTAQDLHDYVLPVMGRLQLQLQTGQHMIADCPEQLPGLLAGSLAQLRDNTAVIRRIQQNLVIRPLEYGLAAYLQELVQRFRDDSGILVEMTLPVDLDTAVPNLDARHAIYAVWQQALDNIQTHAQASHVSITCQHAVTGFCFQIQDNGQGCTPAKREKAIANGHFGLRSMQIRLESVGGTFEFHSHPGHGATITGALPSH
ncbi:MAG TPA: GAF domain-containing protein [Chloroflexota bacterium]|nr:GAF domain-containing protein [Chloroflexota bacterium]HUM69111.1 GAF domain-containing protein [Chloroflexota bacterium]